MEWRDERERMKDDESIVRNWEIEKSSNHGGLFEEKGTNENVKREIRYILSIDKIQNNKQIESSHKT